MLTGVALALLAAVATAACGDDDEPPAPGELGGSCEPEGGCVDDLECTPSGDDFRCTYPAGHVCNADDSDLENSGCADSMECEVPENEPEGEAVCLIKEGEECQPATGHCRNGLVCEEMVSDGHRCFAPVLLSGKVTNSSHGAPIEGAHVIGLDDEGSAATSVSVTDEEGNYSLQVPVARNEDGSPADERFTLRGSAQNYQPFPEGVRVALPILVEEADATDDGYVVDNAQTDIALIPLPPGDRYAISGTVSAATVDDDGVASSDVTGALVVASGSSGVASAVTDKDGSFTIFNVEDGSYVVDVYAAGLQTGSANVTIDGTDVSGVELEETSMGTVELTGNVQIVNASGGSMTSVILVVEDTFEPTAARGEVPRGLRAPRTGAPNVSGDFAITGVPDGTYVVLAAYENDDLVRDPDTNIAGTDFVVVTVDANDGTTLSLSESFKVTEALEVFAPGAERPEAVNEAPMLRWADDSSEDWYEVRVYDAFGDEVWADLDVPGVSGNNEVAVSYDGPMDAGMYYQFRVQSWRQPGGGQAAPISATEDLRGVFFVPAVN